jgi:hypothetical protein
MGPSQRGIRKWDPTLRGREGARLLGTGTYIYIYIYIYICIYVYLYIYIYRERGMFLSLSLEQQRLCPSTWKCDGHACCYLDDDGFRNGHEISEFESGAAAQS